VKSAVVELGRERVSRPLITPIASAGPAEEILATLAGVVRHHLAGLAQPPLGVACGMPGPFDYQAGISYIRGVAKYETIYGLDLRAALRERLGQPALPILFRNDAEAAIVGEARFGLGQPYQRLIGLTLGTGLGSAFIHQGVPLTSGPGVPPNGWLYDQPVHGQLADDVFSSRGLIARLTQAGVKPAEIEPAAQSARQGNALARQVFADFGRDLGQFIQPFGRDFQAEALLVLGGIAGAFDLFAPWLGQSLPVPVWPGRLGADAALLGAASLFEFEPL
jgi:glucokinase